jgi:hypothetical protein
LRTEHDLIHLLDDEPPTPSAVDIRGAITTGGRRRRMRRAGFAGATATALAVAVVVTVNGNLFAPDPAPTDVAGPDAMPTSCGLADLPPVRSKQVTAAVVTGADATGRYLVGRTEPVAEAVLWRDGQAQITDLPGTGRSAFTDVNSAGTVVGWRFAEDGEPEPVPFIIQQETVTPLPGVTHGFPFAVNNSGTVVGESGGSAVRWSSALDDATRLPVPSGTQRSSAVAVDQDGTVAGTVDGKAFVWRPDGTGVALPAPDIDGTPASITTVSDIRNGWVVGSAGITGRPPVASSVPDVLESVSVRWNLHTGEMRLIEESRLVASAVTADGWLVGAGAGATAPAMVAGETTLALPLPADSVPAVDSRYTVSDDGHTVTGLAVDASGTRVPVVWFCI